MYSKRLNNGTLFLIFLSLALIILIRSYFSPEGFVSPDSTKYLGLAQNLLNGDGFYVWDLLEAEKEWFSRWPMGYPVFIFIIAKFTGLSVFWSSKIVNILFLGLSLLFLKKLFPYHTYMYALLFFAAAYIEVFTYSWTEGPFITGLIWFALSLNRYEETERTFWLIQIGLASIFLFMMRYVGFFSIGVIGLIFLMYLFKKKGNKSISFLLIMVIVTIFDVLYLFHNYLETGYMTGIPRSGVKESTHELFIMLKRALLEEVNLFYATSYNVPHKTFTFTTNFMIILFIVIIAWSLKSGQKMTYRSKVILLTGLLYYFGIIYLRFTSDFDPFSFRLLCPGTMLIVIFLLSFMEDTIIGRLLCMFRSLFITILLLSFFFNGVMKTSKEIEISRLTYEENMKQVQQKYEFLPKRSIIAFGSPHLLYLKPESRQIYIYGEMEDFLKRVETSYAEHVFVEITGDINPSVFGKTVVEFMETHDKEQFVKLK